MTPLKMGIFLLNLATFLCILFLSPLEPPLAKGLSIFVFIAVLWVTEIFHVSITSLLVPLLAVLLGVFDVSMALVEFSNPVIFLFMGGFALAASMHKHQLDQRVAASVLRLAKGHMLFSSFIIFGLTAFSSMWMSNTATIAMMIPLVLGLLSRFDFTLHRATYLYFLLGTAFSGSIGGMGTLIGSPPNAMAASAINIGFLEWMLFGVPIVLLALPVMIAILYLSLRPQLEHKITLPDVNVKLSSASKKVAFIFTATVLCWVFGKPLSAALGISGNIEALIAIAAVIALSGTRVVSWQDISASTNWGVLILFGGGITLSSILNVTGTSLMLAESLTYVIQDAPLILFMIISVAFVIFLTELVSNTASAALLIPIFMAISDGMHLSSSTFAVVIALSASCAFMLPVATPPNAIVFGTGYIPQQTMMKIGLRLNLVLVMLIAGLAMAFI